MILRSRARESSALPTAFLRPRWTKPTSGGVFVFASGEGGLGSTGAPAERQARRGELPGTYGTYGTYETYGKYGMGLWNYGTMGRMGQWDVRFQPNFLCFLRLFSFEVSQGMFAFLEDIGAEYFLSVIVSGAQHCFGQQCDPAAENKGYAVDSVFPVQHFDEIIAR